MKKIWIGFIILLLTMTVFAKIGIKDQEVEFTFNIGLLTDKDFKFNPLCLYFGTVFDIHALDFIMISPELSFTSIKLFSADSLMYFAPGITLNFNIGDPGAFFFGGGVSKRFNMFPNHAAVPLDLKLNLGVRTHNRRLRLGAFLLTPFKDIFKTMAFGLYIGFGFFFT